MGKTRSNKLENAVNKIYDAFISNERPRTKQRCDEYQIYKWHSIVNFNLDKRTISFQGIEFNYTFDNELIILSLMDSPYPYQTWMCQEFLNLIKSKFGDISKTYDISVLLMDNYMNERSYNIKPLLWKNIKISSLTDIKYYGGQLYAYSKIHRIDQPYRRQKSTFYIFLEKMIEEKGLISLCNNSNFELLPNFQLLPNIFYHEYNNDENYELFKKLIENPSYIEKYNEIKEKTQNNDVSRKNKNRNSY